MDRTAENNIAIFVEVFCFEGLTANPPSSIMDFGGFYSIIILMLRHGIPRPACREFPGKFEWTMLVGRLGVYGSGCEIAPDVREDLTNWGDLYGQAPDSNHEVECGMLLQSRFRLVHL